ncbi:ankyrin repeat domain-containing protein [Aspergillus mulundensis]|uniref:Uncharacterized protein n=1 Tax=Aspergillus mulundensis TaxID=1810919 RepID=A0A3D8RYZ2_9EURO|nr:hypothetical protein DSM5745_05932 [Aspergillus mulundensis]RDW79080.1 hypothetical protein DSM5745_05932 [Aspergillus mulundensis]
MVEATGLSDNAYNSTLEAAIEYDNVSKLSDLILDPRSKPYCETQEDGISLLQIAARKNSTRALKHLLDAGMDVSAQDTMGRVPLHDATDSCAHILLEHGASNGVKDHQGNTPFHLRVKGREAWRRDYIVKPLVDKHLDRQARLEELNDDGCTPMAVALSAAENDIILSLLPHYLTDRCFTGSVTPYEEVLKAGLDSVIEAFVATNISLGKEPFPLHHISPSSSIQSVRSLKSLRENCCSQRHKGRLLIEALLKQLPGFDDEVADGLLGELIPQDDVLKADILEFLCSEVIPADPSDWAYHVLEIFLHHEIFAAYEAERACPAFEPIVDAILTAIQDAEVDADDLAEFKLIILKILKPSYLKEPEGSWRNQYI